jgi:hypothetical protein
MGFNIPLDAWLRGPLKEWMLDLTAPNSLRHGYLNEQSAVTIVKQHISGKANHGYALWADPDVPGLDWPAAIISMRILVFANFPPYVMGGAENQVARLVEAWLDQGHSAEVAGFGIPNRMVAVGRHAVRLHHLHVFRAAGRLGRGGSYFLSVLYFLTQHSKRFDIIYTRGLGEAAISVCIAKMMGFCGLPLIACPINAPWSRRCEFHHIDARLQILHEVNQSPLQWHKHHRPSD